MSEETRTESAGIQELIAFCIGEQEFCVDIQSVREIRGYAAATPLPHAPSFVTGVINLRGTVLPIVDLASRLGFGSIDPTARSVIIVVRVGQQMVGLLVDAVSDILTVTEDLLQPTPDLASDLARTFVRGVMAVEGRMISLIAVDNILPQKMDYAA
ncbi:chemotaxis protein CheW [Consotaella salsifontis]|uniref:Purine-binding chemotaxis protein CheW n=1 Tax=Consotaella salsifontis TaxID=1365950 RepID=A0A1T4T9P4_9HYPH|nr:chemotaxis protein CheW [Consotaella salsifontis]SKA37097.1 purine-binding chemotaxis protein CheW [Consotaella salsifontis]